MGLLAFCANAAALSQGKWVAWPKCQGCARRLDGSDFTKAAGVAAPPSDGPDNVEPRVWAPNSCALRVFDGKEARACLRRRPLALVGDATTQGIFDELRLLAWDYEFPPGPPPAGLTYVQRPARLDARLAQNIKSKYEPHMVIVNVGGNFVRSFVAPRALSNCRAYLGSFLRRVPHPTMPRFLVQNGSAIEERHVAMEQFPGSWKGALTQARQTRCGIHAGRAAERLERGVDGVRAFLAALNGTRAVWRASALNLGTDVDPGDRERVNALLLEINKQVKAFAPEVLDVEAFSAARPETFFSDRSPHLHCGCPAHDAARATRRCFDPVCDSQKRRSRFDNGEPSRYLAQMVLHTLCGGEAF